MSSSMVARVLVADDEGPLLKLMVRWLEDDNYEVRSAQGGEEAFELLKRESFALLITDIQMPGRSGLELLSLAQTFDPRLAVLLITGLGDRRTAIGALRSGAYGYLIKPFDQNELLINVANALERRRLRLESLRVREGLEDEVRKRTAEIRRNQEEILARLLTATEMRDAPTGAHIRRISHYSEILAEALGWEPARIGDIKVASAMHDIGKIGIPDRVLLKPGKLSPAEYELMKEHTWIGARVLENSDIPLLQMAREIALTHHERWDGSGYPRGLVGTDIPESGRIVAVADVYDALVTPRVYRPALPEKEVIDYMIQDRERQFDPRVLDAFVQNLARIRTVRMLYPDVEALS